ncbi:MAG: hypothetical protein WD825_10155 [Gemmatimonadaceae bacterium]
MAKASEKSPSPDALELAATAASAAIIVALVAFLVWDAFQPSRPAAFEAVIEAREQRDGQLYVPVAIRNTGDEAANGSGQGQRRGRRRRRRRTLHDRVAPRPIRAPRGGGVALERRNRQPEGAGRGLLSPLSIRRAGRPVRRVIR